MEAIRGVKADFLDLINILIGRKAEGELKDTSVELQSVADLFNTKLGIKSEKDRLFVNVGGYDIAPVPFAAVSPEVKFVYWGLNPLLSLKSKDFEKSAILSEKLSATTNWDSYADFYASGGAVKHVISPTVPYYRKVAEIMASLQSNKSLVWSELKKEKGESLNSFLVELFKGYMAIETIPFHSSRFSVPADDIVKLYKTDTIFSSYINKLTQIVKQRSSDDAWIICNGKAAKDLFYNLFESELTKVSVRNERDYSLYRLGTRKVVLIHKQYGTQPSWINSTVNKKIFLDDARNQFSG